MINTLPIELNYEILYHLPIASLLNICSVNTYYASICNDQTFWHKKLCLDYPEYCNNQMNEWKGITQNLTWKDKYLNLVKNKIKLLPIYLENKFMDYIWISRSMTQTELLSDIFNMTKLPPKFYFVHIILNTPSGNAYIPIIENSTHNLTQSIKYFHESIWNNALGFNIIEGLVTYVRAILPDEIPSYVIHLPYRPPMRFYVTE